MRRPDQRRADLRAQLAAGRVGGRRLLELHERFGAEKLGAGVRARSSTTPSGAPAPASRSSTTARTPPATCSRRARATSRSPSQPPSRATASRSTSPAPPTSTRATSTARWPSPDRRATSRSACSPIPTSRRAPAPTGRVEVIAPEGCLLNARPPAAVVGGNVETSSRVADVVLRAFGRALGQGTMNNVTLGSEDVVYYETIGGGQGACPDADGPSGVHVAMSNTLNTPIEALELEFPMRMVRVRAAPRVGRRWSVPRRRRGDPRARGARAAAATR